MEIVFLFPGGGAQHVDMGRGLYREEETFRREMDRCCDLFAPRLDRDLRELIFPSPDGVDEARRELGRPTVFLPALFAVEHSLARLWMSWGVRPAALIGHSFGEYVAATLAGVFRLEDAVALLAERGRLFETLRGGAMLSVTLPAAEVEPLLGGLGGRLSLAVDNGPDLCVVAGFADAVEALEARLAERGAKLRRVPVEGASHCLLVDPILEPFRRFVAGLTLSPPAIPYISNVTGTWATAEQAADPACWARHLRETVRFRQGLAELGPDRVLLEVGPGTNLGSLARRQPGIDPRRVVSSMRHPSDPQTDQEALLAAAARLWELGARPDSSEGPWDRLPDPEPAEETGDDDTTRALAGLFRELLGVESVGPGDSFLELGGHSLLATQLLSRVRQTWGVEIPVERLFAAPTPTLLAREIAGARSGPAAPPLVPVPRDNPLPLSFAQRRLWFLDRLEPGSPLYNIAASFRLRGTLDAGALERSLTEIVRRHEVLRTVFAEVDGEPVQIVGPPFRLELPLVELPGDDEAQLRAREALLEPFDLDRGPLIRGGLVRLGPDHWRLDLALHHVVFDRWSRMVFERELEALYTAFSSGRPSPLPELPLQYADFAVWQRRWMQGEVLAEQLAFWSETLQGLPDLELPGDRPRPPVQVVQGHGGGRRTLAPTGAPSHSGATLFMSLLAAFAVLLARHADSEDLAVGSPIAGRNRAEVEGLIGFFVNTLALRVRLDGDPTFGELVNRVRETCLAAYAHQDLPFERLVEELAPARDLGRAPVFQVMLVLQNAPARPLDLPGLEVEPVEVTTDTAKADLTLFVRAAEEGLAAEIEYSADLFDAATVDRLGERWAALLRAVSADPGLRVSELPVLAAEDERQVLREWPGRRVAYARDATLPELFARQVSRSPEAVALVQGSESLTYAELHRRAGRVARLLCALGVGPEVPVGLLAERSPTLIAGMLGILQAGGAYVPLDPTHPPERWAELLEDVGAPVLVTAGTLSAGLPRRPAAVVHLEEALESVSGGGALSRAAGEGRGGGSACLDADNLAYVMYTSGSTGTPKGVAVTHRNVVRLIDGADYVELGPEEAFLQLAPVAFDASTLEIWGPLLTGGRLVLFPGDRPDLAELGKTVRDGGVTALWLTAGLFHAWIDAGPELDGVRQLLAGGDVVEPGAVRRLLEAQPGIAFINGYGPTEGTTFTCCHRITEPPAAGRSTPIGRPISNTMAWVLDRNRRPVPAGVPGELYAGGDGVARGYAGRPDLTAERFVPSPFSPLGLGERLYRTGDLARWLPDGTIEFLGRADSQIKVSGVRVEPAEVEAALARHPAVRQAAVVPVQGAAGRTLAACVALEQTGTSAAELRAWLRERLPEAFVPTRLAIVDELPLTPNGKVDRAAISHLQEVPAGEAPEEPLSPMEEVLAGLWAAALGRSRIGRRDSFFDLGGHSLLAVRLLSEIRRTFGFELPLRALFEHPTVAELARLLADQEPDSVPLPPVEPAPGRKPDEPWTAPLSASQQRLWFLDRLVPGGAFLNVARAVELRGDLDPGALRRALAEVVARHEALRTAFAMEGGRPVQRIAPPAFLPLPEIDLEALPAAPRRLEAERLAWTEARRPFDPATGPLLRAFRVRLESGRSLLLLTVHHLVLDGWSLGIVFRELEALYGSPSSLPAPAAQYPDFAVWQQELVRTPAMERQRAFWRARLEGLTELRLRGDRPRPAHPTFAGARLDEVLPPGLVATVDRLRVGNGATLFMAVLAAFEALMARYCGALDFAVGSPVASRGRPELHGVVGFCVNMLPLRADLSGNPGWRQLLERVRDDALAAYAHQDLPFETLVEKLRTERDLGSSPLFQVAMTVEDEPPLPSFPGLAAEPWEVDPGPALFDLTLFAARAGSGLRLTFNYKTALFDRATVQRLAGHFGTLLAGMAADPDYPLADLPLLTSAERQALREWNAPPRLAPDGDLGLIGLFERQAARTPDAVAVTGPSGESLIYLDLNARANRIAHRLRELGVGRGTPVGLCLPPSPDLLAGMIGIVKAGGAYVPLDPTYPAERWAVILDEARVPLLVTTSPLAALLPASCGARLLLLDALEDGLDVNPVPLAGEDDLLYLIFTSGSTGRPKGVAIVRRPFADLVRWYTGELAVDETDVFLILTSAGFDLTQKNLWGPLTRGARVLFTPGYDPAVLTALVEREGATAVNCTPSAFYPLIEREEWGRLASLRKVVVGGETTALERLARWRATASGSLRLLNTYGPTECTDMAGFIRLDGWDRGPAPLGRPIPGAGLWVVDPALQAVPAGVAGQIAIGGPCVGPGYLRAPAATAERFVPDPFSDQPGEPGARLYLTGDLARQLPDGVLEFLGRIDHQVKVRGHRVEPGEVEAALSAHPAVRRAAVLACNGSGSTYLAAWIAPQPGWEAGSALPAELRGFLRRRLPEPMVPSVFQVLDELPLTPHGKVDRDALTVLPPPRQSSRPARGPGNEVERAVARAWQRVLGVAEVGGDDNFFDLGGHSLAMIAVQEELRRDLGGLGMELSLVEMFENPTPRSLAERIEGRRAGARAAASPPPQPGAAWKEQARRARDWAQGRQGKGGVAS